MKKEEVKLEYTNRGFGHCDLVDKYNHTFHIRQSSGNMNDVWLGIDLADNFKNYTPADLKLGHMSKSEIDTILEKIGNVTMLIDHETWQCIKKARNLVREWK